MVPVFKNVRKTCMAKKHNPISLLSVVIKLVNNRFVDPPEK